MDILEQQRFIFGSLFLIPNKLQVIVDRTLAKHELTAKQWFLTAMIEKLSQSSPTLMEVAEAMGSSYQNVKSIALKLQEKNFMVLEKDPEDRRVTRLRSTEKSADFWDKHQEEGIRLIAELFSDFTPDEVASLYKGLMKMNQKLQELE
ncbi:MAG TPA: MarR family transcriptional regulator [Desulfosporosinus sp.]|nr:MarR family transcriptional regulator [Desulfosporosinus sp.]